jgi:hypothetical protein
MRVFYRAMQVNSCGSQRVEQQVKIRTARPIGRVVVLEKRAQQTKSGRLGAKSLGVQVV